MIDMEHGPTDFETAYRMVTALASTPADAWIRVTTNDAGLIKRALDAGARDIVVPMVNTREEAEQAVAAAKYPPAASGAGDRSARRSSGTPPCSTIRSAPTTRSGSGC